MEVPIKTIINVVKITKGEWGVHKETSCEDGQTLIEEFDESFESELEAVKFALDLKFHIFIYRD